jgi:DNA (cytosine-5)-methyltransferase 1
MSAQVKERSANSLVEASTGMTDIELFAGGGGMAVGLKKAGFSPSNFYEADANCCETLKTNIAGKKATLAGGVTMGKAEDAEWTPFQGRVRLLAAGAPCQPFSLGGKHQADQDARNLFPEVLRAVRTIRPMAILLENVRGLGRESFQPYFAYVIRQLRFPSHGPHHCENWIDHDARLKKIESVKNMDVEYQVNSDLFDAADFGVPQNRQRIFIVAMRADFPAYVFPKKTHSREALDISLHGKEYWERHDISRPAIYKVQNHPIAHEPQLLPWITVRDALAKMPEPARMEDEAEMNHWVIPGAKSYEGHTGSRMDWPAKTIKAGVHGVPGGENTVTDSKGKFRYFTLRETARIQSFPDEHEFIGARIHVTRQIGNAVPSQLAATIATPLFHLIKEELTTRARKQK